MNGSNTILFIIWPLEGGWCYFRYNYPNVAGWRHLAVTYNGSNIRGFANGKEISGSSYPLSCNGTFLTSSNESIVIGSTSPTSSWAPFYGQIDNLRIYTRALSSAQIKQHYAEGAKKRGLLAEK